MFDQVGWCGNTLPVEFGEGRFEIESVPVDDGIDQQVQPRRPVELTLECPVSQFSEPVGVRMSFGI